MRMLKPKKYAAIHVYIQLKMKQKCSSFKSYIMLIPNAIIKNR